MPPPPELRHTGRLIRRAKVVGKVEPQQEGDADGHVAVARKVAIDLERVPIDPHQVFEARIQGGIVEDALHEVHADIVGDDGFLEESAHQEEHPPPEHGLGHHQRTAYLGQEVAGTHDGTGYQLGKERDIERIVEQAVQGLQLPAIDIEGIAERLEGEERDAHGQEDIQRMERAAPQRAQPLAEQVGVLEVAEQSQVDAQAHTHQQLPLPLSLRALHAPGQEVVAQRHHQQQEEIPAAAFIVEIVGKRRHEQQPGGCAMAQQAVEGTEAQKQEQEHA